MEQDKQPIEKAVQLIQNAQKIVVFTGISVESGIPDFRSPGGLWEKFDPSIYAHYGTFLQQPEKFWEMSAEVEKLLSSAQPNPAHYALADLESMGKLSAVITQNIDHLHQDAGCKKVYELHGNAKSASCVSCSQKVSIEELKEMLKDGNIPKCKSCTKLIKTDVILFGEALPTKVIEDAMAEVKECDLVIMIGSSLTVSPANYIPAIAKARGAKLLFINKDPTPVDEMADVVICGKAGEVLPEVVKALKAKQ